MNLIKQPYQTQKDDYELNDDYYSINDSIIDNSQEFYLQEISKIPLLSLQQERELAKRIANGDEEAKQTFVESNLRLVVSIARKYMNKGLPLLDLIQEGSLGLMTAINKYDVKTGYKFSTYATYWIINSITSAIFNTKGIIRIPVQMYKKIGLYRSTIIVLQMRLNREPKVDEIADAMNLSIKDVNKLEQLQKQVVSLNNQTFFDDDDTEIIDILPDLKEIPEEISITNNMQFQIRKLIKDCNLSQKEIDILILRYGFNGDMPKTLEEIGKIYNVTRERIRQIEARVLKKLRNSNNIEKFLEYTKNSEKALENLEAFRKKDNKTKTLKK